MKFKIFTLVVKVENVRMKLEDFLYEVRTFFYMFLLKLEHFVFLRSE
jgi:hypothetical protein